MRATKRISVKRYEAGATDDHGNEVESWTEPEQITVYGWGPAYGSVETGNSRVVVGIDVFMPNSLSITALDRVLIGSDEYHVDGELADYSHGPFGFKAGVVMRLKRVER